MGNEAEHAPKERSLRQLVADFDNSVGDLGKKIVTQMRVFQHVLNAQKDLREALRIDDVMHEQHPDHKKALEITKGQIKQLEQHDRTFQCWIRLEHQMVEFCRVLIEQFVVRHQKIKGKRTQWTNEFDEIVNKAMEKWIVNTKKRLEKIINCSTKIVGQERMSKIVPRAEKNRSSVTVLGLVKRGGVVVVEGAGKRSAKIVSLESSATQRVRQSGDGDSNQYLTHMDIASAHGKSRFTYYYNALQSNRELLFQILESKCEEIMELNRVLDVLLKEWTTKVKQGKTSS